MPRDVDNSLSSDLRHKRHKRTSNHRQWFYPAAPECLHAGSSDPPILISVCMGFIAPSTGSLVDPASTHIYAFQVDGSKRLEPQSVRHWMRARFEQRPREQLVPAVPSKHERFGPWRGNFESWSMLLSSSVTLYSGGVKHHQDLNPAATV